MVVFAKSLSINLIFIFPFTARYPLRHTRLRQRWFHRRSCSHQLLLSSSSCTLSSPSIHLVRNPRIDISIIQHLPQFRQSRPSLNLLQDHRHTLLQRQQIRRQGIKPWSEACYSSRIRRPRRLRCTSCLCRPSCSSSSTRTTPRSSLLCSTSCVPHDVHFWIR